MFSILYTFLFIQKVSDNSNTLKKKSSSQLSQKRRYKKSKSLRHKNIYCYCKICSDHRMENSIRSIELLTGRRISGETFINKISSKRGDKFIEDVKSKKPRLPTIKENVIYK